MTLIESLEAAEAAPSTPAGGTLFVMDQSGDTRITWDRRNVEEVENARATFDRLRAKGYNAYSVKPEDGSKNVMITTFDPNAEKIILAPPLVGG